LAGTGQSTINVFDAGTTAEGIDDVYIYGTLQEDFFLLRAQRNPIWGRVMASVSEIQVDAERKPVPNGFVERVNYDAAIEGRFVIYGRDGDDTFVVDDNMAPTVIFGDAGDDTFQVGQVYASPRDGVNPDNGLAPEDYFETTQITRGYLSNGVSVSTTMFGGTGNDSFTVYHNTAELFLFGDEDDDSFLVRAFVRVNPNDPDAPYTNINGGQGADFISFTVNAPVRIDGGDGFDTLTVIGTEFGDDFVVTDKGVFGAGLYITYTGLEKIVVDALEGNDRFFIASTSDKVAVEIVGGLGSDTFNVAGGNDGKAITVVSNSLEGHSGLVINEVSSSDADFNKIFVQDISARVGDNDEAGAIVTVDQPLLVFEDVASGDPQAGLVYCTYQIVLTRSPEEAVRITAAPTRCERGGCGRAGHRLAIGAATIGDASAKGVTLLFDRTNWFVPQTIKVFAQHDLLPEGKRFINIQHTVTQGVYPGDGGAYDGLAVLGVIAEVVDDEVADVIVAESDAKTLVAEGVDAAPAEDTYDVVLSRPGGWDRSHAATEAGRPGEPGSLERVELGGGHVPDIHGGRPESAAEDPSHGLSMTSTRKAPTSRGSIICSRATSRVPGTLRSPTLVGDLADAINADPYRGYDVNATGATLTIEDDRAFTAAPTVPAGSTVSIAAGSVHAYLGAIDVTLTTPRAGDAIEVGDTWILGLNGAEFRAQVGTDGIADTISSLSDLAIAWAGKLAVELGGYYAVSAAGAVLTVGPSAVASDSVRLRSFTAVIELELHDAIGRVSGGSIADADGIRSSTHFAKLVLNFGGTTEPVAKGDMWQVVLDDTEEPDDSVVWRRLRGRSSGRSISATPR
jgi:hypothetical protein